MTTTARPSPAVCPGCTITPTEPVELPTEAKLVLSLPTIHCQVCIAKVEKALTAAPGVQSARVNLTLKRVMVEADPDVHPQALVDLLDRTGFEAHELDAGSLSATQICLESFICFNPLCILVPGLLARKRVLCGCVAMLSLVFTFIHTETKTFFVLLASTLQATVAMSVAVPTGRKTT